MRYLLVVVCAFLVYSVQTPAALATGMSGPIELEGWAWSSTIGWISMNCSNTASCGGSDYKVLIEQDGTTTGYAWSSTIGWIKFGGLSGFPTGSGAPIGNIYAYGAYPDLTLGGWARACAGTTTTDCTSMVDAPHGWDGWIALNGSDTSGEMFRVRMNSTGVVSTANDHWAWGGDVIGWIDFDQVIYGALPSASIDQFTVDSSVVTHGEDVTISYAVSNALSCTADTSSGSDSVWDTGLVLDVTSGVHTVTVTPNLGTTEYELVCSNGVTNTTPATVTVEARSDIMIDAFSPVLGAVDVSGYYDQIDFNVSVSGIPSSPPATASYLLEFDSFSEFGSITNGASVVTLYNVPYTATGPAELRVDVDASGDYSAGSYDENVPPTPPDLDENYAAALSSGSLPPPEPLVTLDADDPVVRSGETTVINVSLTAPYEITCTLQGPGVSETYTTTGGAVGSPVTVTTPSPTTAPLFNTAMFELDCPGFDPFTTTVEVVPNFQEV